MLEYPSCSVIVLNYFGEKVIENTLTSLFNLDYPKEKLEIIVIDNASKDRSREILSEIAKKHQNIKLIYSDKNLGFTKGNNLGMKQAKSKYVILLNNDCVVENRWLKELVNVAEKDNKIFAVNSKILLYPKFINLTFTINGPLTPIYAWLSKSKLYRYGSSKIYLPLWRKDISYKIEVPADAVLDEFVEFVVLLSFKEKTQRRNLIISDLISFIGSAAQISQVEKSKGEMAIHFKLNTKSNSFVRNSRNKIQNAGILVFQDGYGRDIGAIVRYSQQYYEYDEGQYNKNKEVYAACGASILFRNEPLKKIGYLDESFFMYYEDVDICEKARIAGYKIAYTHKSVVRHIHALSSGEGSSFFVYHVEKGRLLHVFYNFPLRVFLFEYFKLFFITLIHGIIFLLKYRKIIGFFNKSKTNPQESNDYQKSFQFVLVLMYFFTNILSLIPKRIAIALKRDGNKVEENYQMILKGVWYSK